MVFVKLMSYITRDMWKMLGAIKSQEEEKNDWDRLPAWVSG